MLAACKKGDSNTCDISIRPLARSCCICTDVGSESHWVQQTIMRCCPQPTHARTHDGRETVFGLQGGAAQLDDEGAEVFAQLLAMVRGAGAVGTTAIECKAITPLVLVDLQKVRLHPLTGLSGVCWVPCVVIAGQPMTSRLNVVLNG